MVPIEARSTTDGRPEPGSRSVIALTLDDVEGLSAEAKTDIINVALEIAIMTTIELSPDDPEEARSRLLEEVAGEGFEEKFAGVFGRYPQAPPQVVKGFLTTFSEAFKDIP